MCELVGELDRACDENEAAKALISSQLSTINQRLAPCEDYYSGLNKVLPPPSANPYSKFFEKLDYMIHKHLTKIYRSFKKLGIVNFGVPPRSIGPQKQFCGFTAWRRMENGGYYQGELND